MKTVLRLIQVVSLPSFILLSELSNAHIQSPLHSGLVPYAVTVSGRLADQLKIAITSGNIEKVKQMVEVKGFKPNVRYEDDGLSPLHYAVMFNRVEIVKLMLEVSQIDLNIRDSYKTTHEYFATDENPKGEVYRGHTPLHVAAEGGFDEIVALLLEKPEIDVNSANSLLGDSALHLAVIYGHKTVVKLLLDNKAKPNLTNSSKNTPLHVAAALDKFDLVKMLIESGADLDARNDEGYTAAEIALIKNHSRVVELLVTGNIVKQEL